MNEKLDWFNWGREKSKLMSEALENAGQAVENLRNSNYRYTDSDGNVRINKEFTWFEFAPQKNNKALLEKEGVLLALGIGPNPIIEEAPRRRDISNRELKGIWPTFVPGLNYIRVRNLDVNSYIEDENDYFQIDETQDSAIPLNTQDLKEQKKIKTHKTQKKKESNIDWNKRMWNQPDADKLADKEITEDMANYNPDRNK